jgi:predicted PurR-regulated permease PerM
MNRTAEQERVRKITLLLLVAFISAVFIAMVRRFLVTLLLAGILSALVFPLYRRLNRLFRGRKHLASMTTLVLLLILIGLPLAGLGVVVVQEGIQVTQMVRPWVESMIQDPQRLSTLTEHVPGWTYLAPYQDQILTRLGGVVQAVGLFIVNNLTVATKFTFMFVFGLILLLYAMFFFLMDGKALLAKILYYLPLPPEDEQRMMDRFVSVTRATLKGTMIIGLIQGVMGGIGFAVAGISSPVFWGMLMAVFSLVPGAGTGIIWVPACIVLLILGKTWTALILAFYFAAVVGSIDNVLRPRLVGRDTQMHELFIFLGTLGGVFLFGAIGFIIGPIVAALFVTIWDIYGVAFRDVLPANPEEEGPA